MVAGTWSGGRLCASERSLPVMSATVSIIAGAGAGLSEAVGPLSGLAAAPLLSYWRSRGTPEEKINLSSNNNNYHLVYEEALLAGLGLATGLTGEW